MTGGGRGALWIGILACVLLACSPPKDQYVFRLEDDRLASLLLDLQFAEVSMTGVPEAAKDSLRTRYWIALEQIYGLPPDALKEEIRHLEMDPEHHMAIVERLGALQDSLR